MTTFTVNYKTNANDETFQTITVESTNEVNAIETAKQVLFNEHIEKERASYFDFWGAVPYSPEESLMNTINNCEFWVAQ